MSDTAPQPPPGESPVQTLARLLEEAGAVPVICGIPLNTTLEERIALLLDRIAGLEAQLAQAERDDVECDGTDAAHPAWWRGNDRGCDATVEVLEKVLVTGKCGNYGSPKLTAAMRKVADLKGALAEAQERLAMAVEALNLAPSGDDYRVMAIALSGRALSDDMQRHIERYAQSLNAALAATAASVAQHTAEVERRGAAKYLLAWADEREAAINDPATRWDGDYSRDMAAVFIADLRGRAAELEGA